MKAATEDQALIGLSQSMPAILAWAMGVNTNVLKQGKGLASWQAADAIEVGVQKPDAVRILRMPSLPQPDFPQLQPAFRQAGLEIGRSLGMSLGYAVLIRDSALGDRRVLRHELRHVAQFEAAGSLSRFLEDYLTQVIQHGYRDAPVEVDARRHESRLRKK